MNKRITSLALVFVMVLSLLATAVPALAAPVGPNDAEYSVEADKTSAAPGEEIKFTVYIQQNGNLNVIEARLKIPTGLTYIPDSGALVENIQATLGWDATDWTPDPYMMVNGYGAESYTGTDKLALMTFKCTVDSDTSVGDYEVTLHEFFTGDDTYNYKPTTCIPATITVTAAPKPATGINLNKEELTLTAGATETLVATVTPSDTTDTVAWSSDKPGVATVDSTGKVTAVAPGEATITAKAGEKTATCTVKVSCAHNLQTVSAKDSNCTEKGWDEYQKCTLCGALFDMSGGSIEGIPYRPLNNDHDFNMSEWGYKGADGHAHVCTRNPAHKDGVAAHTSGGAATETEDEVCTVCGYVIAPATGHVCANHLTKVDRVEADCTTDGNIEHYKCDCGKLYADGTASALLTEEEVKLAAPGHDWKAATCTDPKTCNRCGETEGTALGHNWATEWSSNETKHWHDCSRCGDKKDEAAHTPDRTEATETDPIKCTVCDYVITPATGHVCANHLTKAEAKPADCTNPGNKAYYKCECGKFFEDADALTEIIDHESVVIPALDHDWAGEWSSDETNHWHACTRCDAKTDEAAHTPDHPDGATFEYPVLCVECGYEMEAQREEGTIRVELPFKLTVNKTGEMDPGKEIFKFMAEEFGAQVEYELITSTLETNGAKTYEGIFIFTIKERDAGNLSEGFIFRQVKGSASGWTYDETKFYAVPMFSESRDSVSGWEFYALNEEGRLDYENMLEEIVFTNSYNAKKPDTPQTGDNSNLTLWIVLLIASGSATGITLFSKKRKMNAK